MEIHGFFFTRGTTFALTVMLTGCVSGGGVLPKADNQLVLQSAPFPNRVVGDRTYYTNGRRERVMTVTGGMATVKRSNNYSYGIESTQLFIQSFRQSSNKQIQSRIMNPKGKLWPLQVGNKIEFTLEKSTKNRTAGISKSKIDQFWSCEVDSAEQVSVVAGTFDTFRVNCIRSTTGRNFRQRSYFYYSPMLNQTVLRVDYPLNSKTKRLEMSAFDPAVSTLPIKSARRYQTVFQKTLDNLPSGKSSVWRSKAFGTAITITPVKTFKRGNGQYCRNYLTQIRSSKQSRMGAGLVCKNSAGEWKIPRKVSNRKKAGAGG